MKTESKIILNELIDAYERSRLFREGNSGKRVCFNFSKCKNITSKITAPEIKEDFLKALDELKKDGFIDYTWVKFEKGNLVNNVYLNSDPEKIEQIYTGLGRVSKRQQLETLKDQLKRGSFADEEISEFISQAIARIDEKSEIPAFFFRIHENGENYSDICLKNERLITFLREIGKSDEEQLERVMSARLYGDSKYFEHELRGKVLRILKSMKTEEESEADPDQLLQEKGIFKWPEIHEFCGRVDAVLEEGNSISFAGQLYGAYINSQTVRHIESVKLTGVKKIISIENKANYTWYIQHQKAKSELVLYHGGFFSPAKGKWFKLIQAAGADCEVFHWGDIDLGGFRMFCRLKKEIFPQAAPYMMDLETLRENEARCRKIDSEKYAEELEKLLLQDEYAIFSDVINYMLERKIKLEQENLIW